MRIVKPCVFALALLPVSIALAGPTPKSEEQKTLYAIGLAVAHSLKTFNLNAADLEMVKAGLTDGALNKPPKVKLDEYRTKIRALQQTRLAVVAKQEKKVGMAYTTKAAKQKGAVKTKSGMVYIPVKVGTGPSPKVDDTVKVNYEGKLVDGTIFDSSIRRGKPVSFGLKRVVPCWTEGVQMMKVGGKAQLVCPSDLAYGDHGRPPQIPPGATLVFDVELLDIEKPSKK